jgi:hypothetical protein
VAQSDGLLCRRPLVGQTRDLTTRSVFDRCSFP